MPGPIAWAHRNLFSSFGNSLTTMVLAGLLVVVAVGLFDWLILDAAWHGTTLADCDAASGACWPFLRARFGQFIYGYYPPPERWRIDLAFILAAALALMFCIQAMRRRLRLSCTLLLLWPVVAAILLRGGVGGLVSVETARWGGFTLTLFMAATALAIAMPLGIVLALGRCSGRLAIRTLCVCWIEFWRSVPMLAVLFVAVSMFPLFMPTGVDLDRFTRALSAFVIVTACFVAEAVRGGLQSLPRGQYEAAQSLGLGYWRMMRLVILPQALAIALPSVVSVAIMVFKDTTLINVIGIFCLLGMIQNAATSPEWISETAILTGYAIAAAVYWTFCFGMSRLGLQLEARLAVGRRRT
jgi:general L-amino acid transport system permease protein